MLYTHTVEQADPGQLIRAWMQRIDKQKSEREKRQQDDMAARAGLVLDHIPDHLNAVTPTDISTDHTETLQGAHNQEKLSRSYTMYAVPAHRVEIVATFPLN